MKKGMRTNNTALVLGMMICCVAGASGASRASEIVASSASIPAPKVQEYRINALAFDSPALIKAHVAAREALLGKHHESVPIGRARRPASHAPGASVKLPPATALLSAGDAHSPVEIRLNRVLTDAETAKSTSEVGEPTAAHLGDLVHVTGNWFAASSIDSGKHFTAIDPAKQFPPAGDQQTQPYCCDQIALAVPERGLLLWLLQYQDDGSSDTLRLAVASGASVKSRTWRYYDLTPVNIGGWHNEWFDYPAMAVSSNYLFVTTNAYATQGKRDFTRTLVMRIDLGELAAYLPLSVKYFAQTDVGSIHPALGATATMHLATHSATDTLRLYAWPEKSDRIQITEVPVDPWSDAPYTATGPDGTDWMQRTDGRISAGWEAGDSVGFAWTAAKGLGFPHTQVRVAIIGASDSKVHDQPHIWSQDVTFAYPAVAAAADGTLGISLFANSQKLNVSHVIGVRSGGAWKLIMAAQGQHGPASGLWGDYLAIQALPQSGWLTVGYTLATGGQPQDAQVNVVEFTPKPH